MSVNSYWVCPGLVHCPLPRIAFDPCGHQGHRAGVPWCSEKGVTASLVQPLEPVFPGQVPGPLSLSFPVGSGPHLSFLPGPEWARALPSSAPSVPHRDLCRRPLKALCTVLPGAQCPPHGPP